MMQTTKKTSGERGMGTEQRGGVEKLAREMTKAINGSNRSASRRTALHEQVTEWAYNKLNDAGEIAKRMKQTKLCVRGLTNNPKRELTKRTSETISRMLMHEAENRFSKEANPGDNARINNAVEHCETEIHTEARRTAQSISKQNDFVDGLKRIARAREHQIISDGRGWWLKYEQVQTIGRTNETHWEAISADPTWLMRRTTSDLGPLAQKAKTKKRAWQLSRQAGRKAGIHANASEEAVERVLAEWKWSELDPPLAAVWVHACLEATIEGDEEWGAAIRKQSKGSRRNGPTIEYGKKDEKWECKHWAWDVRRAANEDAKVMRKWIENDATQWLRHQAESSALNGRVQHYEEGNLRRAREKLANIENEWGRTIAPQRASRTPERTLGALGEKWFSHMCPVWTVTIEHACTALWASKTLHGNDELPNANKVAKMLSEHRTAIVNSRHSSTPWVGDIALEKNKNNIAKEQIQRIRQMVGENYDQ